MAEQQPPDRLDAILKSLEKPREELAIIVENEPLITRLLIERLQVPTLQCRAFNRKRYDWQFSAFYDNFSDADLARTSLFIVDHGENAYAGAFASRLRSHNPDAFVLEIGGMDEKSSFSDALLVKGSNFSKLFRVIESQETGPLKIATLKRFIHPEFIEAQKADPNSEWNRINGDRFDNFWSLDYFRNNKRFNEVAMLWLKRKKELLSLMV